MTPDQLAYVVTGLAGSGTGWASAALTAAGSPCGHETVFTGHPWRVNGRKWTVTRRSTHRPGPVCEGESSWKAAPYVAHLGVVGVPVVHLVRDPLAVVRSLDSLARFLADENMARGRDLATNCAVRHVPSIADAGDRLGRLIRYVTAWDRHVVGEHVEVLHIDRPPVDRFRFADLVTRLSGRPVSRDVAGRALEQIGTRHGTHGGPSSAVTWDTVHAHPDGDLLAARAEFYRYPQETP